MLAGLDLSGSLRAPRRRYAVSPREDCASAGSGASRATGARSATIGPAETDPARATKPGDRGRSVGFALVGVWLIVLSRAARSASLWPRRLADLGLVTGLVMALGFVLSPGVLMRLDDANAAPAWVWLGFVSWLGIFVL
jgi:hypothetical protein